MEDISKFISTMIGIQSFRLARTKNSVYLDTNAWSSIAKKEYDPAPLVDWAEKKGYFIWLSRFQLAELAADTRLAEPLADVLSKMEVFLLDMGLHDFSGKPWYKTKFSNPMHIKLNTDGNRQAFVSMLTDGTLRAVNKKTRSDGKVFGERLVRRVAELKSERTYAWSDLKPRLESWIRVKCEERGLKPDDSAIEDPECYVGLRLSYAVLFSRYLLGRKKWEASDYFDYLHSSDMAYAGVVVTESYLQETIVQSCKRPEINGPHCVNRLSWLKELGDC